MRLFRIIAIISLFADAYIGLVLIAMDRMQRAYLCHLSMCPSALPPAGRRLTGRILIGSSVTTETERKPKPTIITCAGPLD